MSTATGKIRLTGSGPHIRQGTDKKLREWKEAGISYGRSIDLLTAFAIQSGFDPLKLTAGDESVLLQHLTK